MLLNKTEIKKIAVFRALQLGDMLCSIPAIRALRAAYPNAEISLLGLPWSKTLLHRFPKYFDRFIWFPGYPGLPEQTVDASAVVAFFNNMIDEQFDLVLQMQGNGTIVNSMVALFNAKHTAGFYLKDDFRPNDSLFIEYPNGISEIERHQKLMQHLGIELQGTDLEFPVYAGDEESLKKVQLPVDPKRYVCVHPGSRGSWRQWPVEYFGKLADFCAVRGLDVVITGTKEELPVVEQVAIKMKHDAIIAAGKTDLGAVAVLIRDAAALISNCTGVSHIASATKTPSIVISMDGEPERWAPLNRELHHTIDWTKNADFTFALDATEALFNHAVTAG